LQLCRKIIAGKESQRKRTPIAWLRNQHHRTVTSISVENGTELKYKKRQHNRELLIKNLGIQSR